MLLTTRLQLLVIHVQAKQLYGLVLQNPGSPWLSQMSRAQEAQLWPDGASEKLLQDLIQRFHTGSVQTIINSAIKKIHCRLICICCLHWLHQELCILIVLM